MDKAAATGLQTVAGRGAAPLSPVARPPCPGSGAPDPLAGLKRGQVGAVVGDRGYDSDDNVRRVRRLRARVVIPPVRRRAHQRRYSKTLYRGRNVVERFWSKVKQYRRVATRYDKMGTSYLAFVHLAAVLVVLKHP